MSSPYFTNSDAEHDSPSPYPPSTPTVDSDSEDERQPLSLETQALRTSMAMLPEYRLRDIMLRLADSNQQFRRALQREITHIEELDTPPTTPTASQRRQKSKRSSRARKSRSCGHKATTFGSQSKSEVPISQNNTAQRSVYHPGRLEDEVYEFVSRTPTGAVFKVVQTVTMWSCCNEDEWSEGCILIAPRFGCNRSLSGPRKLTLDTRSLGYDDVYPDSDLESCGSDFAMPGTPRRGRTNK